MQASACGARKCYAGGMLAVAVVWAVLIVIALAPGGMLPPPGPDDL